jgi:hypothetical protein
MNRQHGLFRAGVVNLLGVSLSERIKRLIFLASFSARLEDRTTFDSETLVKLNEVMALCSTEAAMNLPVHLSKVIWRGKTIHDIVDQAEVTSRASTQERLQRAIEQVLAITPEWLRYGSEARMREDLVRLFNYQKTVFG